MTRTISWKNNTVRLIDQNVLPRKLRFVEVGTTDEMVRAIKTMKVRGAPALGAAGAFGLVLGVKDLKGAARKLIASRPTAVNLRWGVERMLAVARAGAGLPLPKLRKLLLAAAKRLADEDVAINRALGRHGAKVVRRGMNILTVCNAGALATVDYGTALGVIRAAHAAGKRIHVYAAETRPRLQGARLTAWELKQAKVPFTLITDNMIGHLMSKGKIDLVVVGADRIARNGDTANKIGTYNAAVLARAHGVPFYIAAPSSTFDPRCRSGKDIVIEERAPEEVLYVGRERIAPAGTKVYNPAFDVTPARLIKGFITEKGIIRRL